MLADINLEIGPGELICVIGASGCGKSTLLNLTGGFVKADQVKSGSTGGWWKTQSSMHHGVSGI